MLLPKFFASLAIIFVLAAPFALSAAVFPAQLVPCSNKPITTIDATTGKAMTVVENPCNFSALMQLVKNLMDFALFLVMPIAAALFAWAGFLYLTAGANPGNVGKAKGMFWTAAIGLFWTLGAWLVIKLISDALLLPAYTVLP